MTPITIGDVRISSIIERDGPWRSPGTMFPGITNDSLARGLAEVPDFTYDRARDLLVITFQSFVLRTPMATVLIETCSGEHRRRAPVFLYDKTPWLEGLARHGLTFADIDYVFCTHMHVDHVGWNTRLQDGRLVPTFPNAKYIFARREYDYWKDVREDEFRFIFEDCVAPVVAAGQALLVEDDYVLNDQLRLMASNGHSPGHVCIDLRSRGERALFTGDLMHHPVQCVAPDWSTCFCYDRAAAAASRKRVLTEHGGEGTLIIPTHFPGRTAGHAIRYKETWRFRFLGD